MVFCMFQFGGASVYIYIYIGYGPRFWRLQWETEGVCMTEVPNEHTHIVSIETFSTESLEGYKQTPLCFKVGQRHGLRHLLRHPVTQEQSQGGAHGQIKLPHCIHPGPGDRSPAPQFPNPWGPYDTNMPEQPRHHR